MSKNRSDKGPSLLTVVIEREYENGAKTRSSLKGGAAELWKEYVEKACSIAK